MNIFNKIKFCFKDPHKLFNIIKREKIKQSSYFFISLLLPCLILIIIVGRSYFSNEFKLTLSLGLTEIIIWLLSMILLTIIGFLLYFSLIYGFNKLIKGKGNFEDSIKLVIYSLTPYLLFSWIPVRIVLIIALVYFIKLNFIGGKELMGLSKWKSVALTTFHYLLILSVSIVFKLVLGEI